LSYRNDFDVLDSEVAIQYFFLFGAIAEALCCSTKEVAAVEPSLLRAVLPSLTHTYLKPHKREI